MINREILGLLAAADTDTEIGVNFSKDGTILRVGGIECEMTFEQAAVVMGLIPYLRGRKLSGYQGLCETTLTGRYEVDCHCGTYSKNLGPCAGFKAGGDPERCVFCDHIIECHEKVVR